MTSSRSTARRILGGALISLLTLAGLAVAAPASAEVASLTINGVVTTPTGDPVVGEPVNIHTGIDMYQTQTDEAGAFSVSVEYDTAHWTIDVYVYGAYAWVDIPTLGGASETFLSITTPVLETFTIQGLVSDPYGVILPGVVLVAYTTVGIVTTVTDETGHYSITVTESVGGGVALCYESIAGGCLDVSGREGDVVIMNMTIGKGIQASILLEGQYLDISGAPIANASVTVDTDITYYLLTTDEDGAFSVEIEYSEFGRVGIWGDSAWLGLDPSTLLGLDSISVVLQQSAPVEVTFSGVVTDVDGNPVPNHVVVAVGNDMAYTFTDADGRYEVSVLVDQFSTVYVATDGNREPYFFEPPVGGGLIPVDPVTYFDGTENSLVGVTMNCDVNGDGIEDVAMNYFAIAASRNDWWIALSGGDWVPATFGQGEISEAYCADLNGDGASEIIARSETSKYHPRTGKTTIKHTWGVYEYATGTVTEHTFGKGNLTVYFEDLDDAPGVELIAVRTKPDAADRFWILDDPASPVETFKLGFVSEGTLSFEDINDVPGVEIVTSITKPNGNVKVEYYTRATGEGSIVKYTIK